ncbi:ExeM/NucH family extracellular endonuclease [Cellulomonas endophytica]|uniref:ExeM/NucH family extracellular endonuclease n=1 Tax=Cellulomonas endophytica TaxID=2494735 RepID=UPI001013C079|nr:ExeM/NucH family extracellular endonuclease [Cellulomonas endophytica]
MVVTGSVTIGAGAAQAAVSPDAPVVIHEVYGGGGNSGAPYDQDFVELYNPGDEAVSLEGWTLQYGSAANPFSSRSPLSGSIAAGGHLLVGQAKGTNAAAPIAPDLSGTLAMSGSGGKVALASTSAALTCGLSCAGDPAVVDLVGWGSSTVGFAGSGPAPGTTNATSVSRGATHANTADNAADFAVGAPTPQNAGSAPDPDPEPEPDPVVATIAQIQGTGAASPLLGQVVTTTGVVTASYPTGGLAGFVVQTAGSGGTADRAASDAVFVYAPGLAVPAIGASVDVTGEVGEFNGLTQLRLAAATDVTVRGEALAAVTPVAGTWPTTAEGREVLESMLVAPTGAFTITNTYSTNQYGEVGLASGSLPLLQPTDVADAGSPEAAAVAADNAARAVVLDDGATTNFLTAANASLTPPYVSLEDEPIRVGAGVTFDAPVVVDYRNNAWKLNPTAPVVDEDSEPVTFEDTRTQAPEAVGGDLTVASFNVLNYFTTLGTADASCVPYTAPGSTDGVTVNTGCDQRGAWDGEDLDRQQAKIVAAINALDADVVGLLEIENSAALGETTDEALATLTAALNSAAGAGTWAYVPSSGDLPDPSTQDVITNALIYRPAAVTATGPSRALDTSVPGFPGGDAFVNAREPIAQTFTPVGGGDAFVVVVNHFKSKGSAGPLPGDADSGDGQGASNASRVAQATALRDWVAATWPTEAVALVGDFNAYTQEDPLQVLYADGYVDAVSTVAENDDQWSYSFQGLSGSLDHVLLNEAAAARATGADVWEINAEEALALEYSRYGYHGTLFYADDVYRSSDHDPVLVGLTAGAGPTGPVDLTLLNLNDFHGRIDANTVRVAGTIEEQRAAAEAAGGAAVLLSAGDNIGASLFASSVAQDQPTLDVLDALGLAASAVGNHEFDQGYADLVGRVSAEADFPYLGANVYEKGTTTPALPEYALVEAGGVTVGVIGAVTQETPSLVSPGGIATLDFGDPVDAVNRVAAQLSDGDAANGEADVLVAEYHEGAGAGTPDGATLEEEVAAGGAFAEIVTQTAAEVDAIFTGHTHKQYAWQAPVPGVTGATRPVLQTGSYGENIGKVVLTFDPATGEVTATTATNVARTATPDADLVAAHPRVAEVKAIVDAALAYAAQVGSQPVGSVRADITTAFSGGSYVDGRYTGGTRDNRAAESTLGDLVADSLVASLGSPERGGATIGVVNPGGLRGELLVGADGVLTYAEANAVLPFVNNLWTESLTGTQFRTMLEQQWQTNLDGTIPSRPYLQLGLSSNVTYTYDESRAAGDRITSVTVDGEPLDPAGSYRIGTFSFLAQGGDNFRVLAEGTDVRDSGLVDRDAWIAYLRANPGLTPDFAERAVGVPALPASVEAGTALAFPVTGLDLTSQGAPRNTALDVRLDGTSIGSATVTDGAAAVSVTVPAGTTAGAHVLTLVAAPSGTTVTLPLVVTVPVPDLPASTTTLTVGKDRVLEGRADQVKVTATVTGPGKKQSGTVEFVAGDVVLATAPVGANGRTASAKLPADLPMGTYAVVARYLGTDAVAPSESAPVTVVVLPRS